MGSMSGDILEEATPEEKYWVTYTVKGKYNERND